MLQIIRVEQEGNVPKMPTPVNPIFKIVSSFSQQEEVLENIIELGSASVGKKMGKRAVDGTEAIKNFENQIIPLSNEDIASQTDHTP